jgi:two-component system LytT family sensor kinase
MPHPTYNRTLNQKLLWHLKVLAGAVFISLVFAFVLNQPLTPGLLVMPLLLTFMQLELFIWLGNWFFESLQVDAPGFKRQIIIRLLIFYVVVLLLAILLFVVVYAIQYSIHFDDFNQFLPTLLNMEMKGFFIATFVGFGIGGLFFFYVLWAEAVDRVQKLREEKLIFQYETLKSQVNPLFIVIPWKTGKRN